NQGERLRLESSREQQGGAAQRFDVALGSASTAAGGNLRPCGLDLPACPDICPDRITDKRALPNLDTWFPAELDFFHPTFLPPVSQHGPRQHGWGNLLPRPTGDEDLLRI